MIWAVQPFSSQSVTTTQTVSSTPFNTQMGRLCGFEYRLNTATTGTYVSATARILVSADSADVYLTPADSANAVQNVLLFTINSNNKYISYRFDDYPAAAWTQVQLISVTNQTITFDSVRLLYTDN